MKQTIKLNESELHRFIKESVKKAINELDWKTYANAARKRAEQGASDYDVHQLDQAANKALSDKYKITGDGHFPYSPQIDTRKGESVYDTDEEGNYIKKYPHAGQTGRFPQLGYQGDFNDTYYTPIGDNVEDEPYERTTYDNFPAHKERHKDMSSYFSGKSKYEKGKGWSNESMKKRVDRIVAESVRRVIKESLSSYAFHCYIPGLGNEAMLIDNISDAFPYINKAEYWDITKGSNSSEPSNLVAWGGEDGYWSNILNDPETNTRLKELILSKKKN